MTKPSPYPFCVDCKHCRRSYEGLPEFFERLRIDLPICDTDIDLVTGEIRAMQCSALRQLGKHCGLEGRLFEAKGSPSMTVDWSNPDRPHITIDFSAEAKETE